MKKLLFISILTFGIFLAGCGLQKGLSKGELFEKKQECAKLRNDLQKRNEQYVGSGSDENGFITRDSAINEIFYSPKRNSCIFTRESFEYYHNEQGELQINRWLIIEDALTHERIYTDPGNLDSIEDERAFIFFNNKLQELKGE